MLTSAQVKEAAAHARRLAKRKINPDFMGVSAEILTNRETVE